jgi:SAM-dependent methyltransferase
MRREVSRRENEVIGRVKPSGARSFGAVADTYGRGRPGWPAEAIVWVLGTEPLDVLDLGARTGRLTAALLGAGHRVTALEPSAGMREVLVERRGRPRWT